MNRHSSSFNNGMTRNGKPVAIEDAPRYKQRQALAVPEDVLVFAFRYALGRRTSAVETVASEIRAHRLAIKTSTRQQIIDEINEAISKGRAGDEVDVAEWVRTRDIIAGKPIKEDE